MNAPSTILGSSGEDIIQIQPGLNQHEQSKKNGQTGSNTADLIKDLEALSSNQQVNYKLQEELNQTNYYQVQD